MAKVFLDANKFLDLIQGRGNQTFAQQLSNNQVYISPLSTHIMFYINQKVVPDLPANATISQFEIANLTKEIHDKSLLGPTSDFEDNIQLHSAAESECDYFLTNDKKLLKIKYFGKTQITTNINQ